MRTLKQQRGMGFLGILIIMAMSAAIILFALKTGPLYIENASVKTALENLIGMPNIGKKGARGIKDAVDKQLYIDAVESFTAKDLTVLKSKKKKVWIVTADYEAKRTLAANVSVVVHFVKTVEVPR